MNGGPAEFVHAAFLARFLKSNFARGRFLNHLRKAAKIGSKLSQDALSRRVKYGGPALKNMFWLAGPGPVKNVTFLADETKFFGALFSDKK